MFGHSVKKFVTWKALHVIMVPKIWLRRWAISKCFRFHVWHQFCFDFWRLKLQSQREHYGLPCGTKFVLFFSPPPPLRTKLVKHTILWLLNIYVYYFLIKYIFFLHSFNIFFKILIEVINHLTHITIFSIQIQNNTKKKKNSR